jgi:hypothetical protein
VRKEDAKLLSGCFLHELSYSFRGVPPGVVGINDQSAVQGCQTCPGNLGQNIFAVLPTVGDRSFREHVDNMNALGVPHNIFMGDIGNVMTPQGSNFVDAMIDICIETTIVICLIAVVAARSLFFRMIANPASMVNV